jgi:hypothetical protein
MFPLIRCSSAGTHSGEPGVSQHLRTKTYAAILVAAVSLAALPSMAQSLGGYREFCQNTGGRVVCRQAAAPAGATAARPYERWDNGAPARASGSSNDYHYRADDSRQFPQSFGAYSNLGGFGH